MHYLAIYGIIVLAAVRARDARCLVTRRQAGERRDAVRRQCLYGAVRVSPRRCTALHKIFSLNSRAMSLPTCIKIVSVILIINKTSGHTE